ncbi:hypothetical protein PARU111607_03325 [Palleronia rufa]
MSSRECGNPAACPYATGRCARTGAEFAGIPAGTCAIPPCHSAMAKSGCVATTVCDRDGKPDTRTRTSPARFRLSSVRPCPITGSDGPEIVLEPQLGPLGMTRRVPRAHLWRLDRSRACARPWPGPASGIRLPRHLVPVGLSPSAPDPSPKRRMPDVGMRHRRHASPVSGDVPMGVPATRPVRIAIRPNAIHRFSRTRATGTGRSPPGSAGMKAGVDLYVAEAAAAGGLRDVGGIAAIRCGSRAGSVRRIRALTGGCVLGG